MAERGGAALNGLVLAGGRSRRFGRDKAAMRHADGNTWLTRTVALLKPNVQRVFISVRPDQADDEQRANDAVLVDERPGLGPAAGLLAAHARDNVSAWLVLSCDLPMLTDAAIGALIAARAADRDATVYRSPADAGPEPLCAIYEPATLARFRREVESGQNLSPRDFLAGADIKMIDPQDPRWLANINTPDDLEKLSPHE